VDLPSPWSGDAILQIVPRGTRARRERPAQGAGSPRSIIGQGRGGRVKAHGGATLGTSGQVVKVKHHLLLLGEVFSVRERRPRVPQDGRSRAPWSPYLSPGGISRKDSRFKQLCKITLETGTFVLLNDFKGFHDTFFKAHKCLGRPIRRADAKRLGLTGSGAHPPSQTQRPAPSLAGCQVDVVVLLQAGQWAVRV
jgi:hypothetical protein